MDMTYAAHVKKHRDIMQKTLDYISAHPETGYQEWETSKWMETVFEDAGYTLIKAGNIPGFYTDIDTGKPGPKILILAELDALYLPNHFAAVNGNAHACGHHAQCAAMAGIALALKEPGALEGLSGSIRLMLVPAEELIEPDFREGLRKQGIIRYLGGKAEFLHRGYMDGVDLAFMFHTGNRPGSKYDCQTGANGCLLKTIEYEGVAAHAGGSPHLGVNALYAASLGLQAVNALRETFQDAQHIRVHPIMTEGGATVNIIPASARLSSFVRGASMEAIGDANHKVNRAFAAGALALGAKLMIHDRPGYAPLINSPALAALAKDCMAELVGEEQLDCAPGWGTGSTDMGDLSCIMPVVHPHISGAVGTSHGDDYRIADFENACVLSAEGQLLLAARLLESGAAKAKEIIAGFAPRYESKEAYFAHIDEFNTDRDMISYDGKNVTVHL